MKDIRSVPVVIEMTVKISAFCIQEEVKKTLLEELSNRALPDGRKGFFQSDNFTLGQSLLLSTLVKVASTVPGIVLVNVTKFERMDKPDNTELSRGRIDVGPLEKIQVENSSVSPHKGQITVNIDQI